METERAQRMKTTLVIGGTGKTGRRVVERLEACGLYLVGAILPTISYHVPRNEALARVEPHSADAESHWRRYLSGWTAWNHVRAAAALAAAAVLTIALHVG